MEAEQSVLGSMLLDKEIVPQVAEMLRSEDFYREDHQAVFEAIMELFNRGKPIDIITVSESLRSKKSLDAVGGIAYLTSLTEMVPTTASISYYAKIVEEKSLLRKLIKASSDVIATSYDQTSETPAVLDLAERSIFDIAQGRRLRGFVHVKDLLNEAFELMNERARNGGKIIGIPSGFADLDDMLLGFQKSDLILIAARPGVGKTTLAMNIAAHAAIHKDVTVAIFSLEMPRDQLITRMLSSEVMVDFRNLRTGQLDADDWEKLGVAAHHMSRAPIYIDDTPSLTITDIRSKCRRLAIEKNLGMVVIDYLQLMQGGARSENRQQEISEISRSMKILAKELQIPVICLSQLSRAPEARTDHRPMLSDLRESGAIEQDADIVLFIYRDEMYNKQTEKRNVAELIIAKHRNGGTGTVEIKYFGQYVKFANFLNES
jgi:replicative DNA helicase